MNPIRKRLFLLLAYTLPMLFAKGQYYQITANRVFVGDSLRVNDWWIKKITRDLNTADSNSQSMMPTNRAVMDAIRRGGGGGGSIGSLDQSAAVGNQIINKDVFLNRSSGGQLYIRITNKDTLSGSNGVASIDILSWSAKAVSRMQTGDTADIENQTFRQFRRPGTYDSIGVVKSWVWGRVGKNPNNPNWLWHGWRLVNAENGNSHAITVDSISRVSIGGDLGHNQAPRAWLNIQSGNFPAIHIKCNCTPTDSSAGDMDYTGNDLTIKDGAGVSHGLMDQTSRLIDGTFTGGSPNYVFHPSLTFAGDNLTGIMRSPTLHTLTATTSIANQATLLLYNSDVNGYPGIDYRNTSYGQQGMIFFNNADDTHLNIGTRGSRSIDFQAGSGDFGTWAPQMRLTPGGNFMIGTTSDNGYKLNVNGAISTVTDSAASPKNMAWIDTDGKIRKAAVPSGSSTDSAIWKNDGTMTADHTLFGNGKKLVLGKNGSRLSRMDIQADSIVIATSGEYGMQLYGTVTWSTTTTILDNDFISAADHIIILNVQITANRTITLPTPSSLYTGREIYIWNKNNTANSWQFSGNVVDAAGSTITNLTNRTWYKLICDGSVWSKTN